MRAFDAAVRTNSFTRAGESLHVTQGAISRQVKVLEDWLGKPLFVRHYQGLTPTPAGSLLAQSLDAAFGTIQDAVEQIGFLGARQRISVNVPETFASRWLAPRGCRAGLRLPDGGGDFRQRRRAIPEPGRDVKIKRDILLLAAVSATLAGCGPNDPQAQLEARDEQIRREMKLSDSSFFDLFRNQGDPEIGVQVNRYLWQASLDILSFLPLEGADPPLWALAMARALSTMAAMPSRRRAKRWCGFARAAARCA